MLNFRHPQQAASIRFIITLASLFLLTLSLASLSAPSQAHAQAQVDRGVKVFIPLTLQMSAGMQLFKPNAPPSAWLNYVNAYRAMANLPPVDQNIEWSTGGLKHSIYTVKNDILEHNEHTGNAWYTPEGLAAARSGNLMATSDVGASDEYAIDSWMQAPFHAVGILDPALQSVGFGSYREGDGSLQMSASLDVIRGLGAIPAAVSFPIMFPANGATVPLTRFHSEHPDPLSSCPGYSTPSGLPLILQIGPGNLTPVVMASSISQGGAALEHCVFTEATYENPDAGSRQTARAILDSRDAIVIIPRQPLAPGATYTASITANGQTYIWSFNVTATPRAGLGQ